MYAYIGSDVGKHRSMEILSFPVLDIVANSDTAEKTVFFA